MSDTMPCSVMGCSRRASGQRYLVRLSGGPVRVAHLCWVDRAVAKILPRLSSHLSVETEADIDPTNRKDGGTGFDWMPERRADTNPCPTCGATNRQCLDGMDERGGFECCGQCIHDAEEAHA